MSKNSVRHQAKNHQEGDPNTTGHSWDGIEEFDNPMPRWWLWSFYACIAFALVYSVMYPAWPMISRATPGLLGASTRADVAAEIQEFSDRNAPIRAKLEAAELTAISADPELSSFANNAGAAVFRTWCAQCHGSGAAGAKGYPNLLDDDWLWGGDIEAIHTTITHGIRNTTDEEARISDMPRFGADELLEKSQIDNVVQFVRSISKQENDPAMAAEGAVVFEENCAACHGEEGKGNRDLGAPNLTDAIWLFGGDVADLTYTVTNSRHGVMPNWNTRLSEADIRAVAVYVHGLGGGE
ncbi:cytochrome-c oxidase, cbb3-type subunit III [Pseudorhodobacter wandonensis]|jgi:cytochrome c oxidase cbb3-type subunit 3|uniref:cytochrome-c oxidase, cbb3-type subunit III n=1 Tax=Pseudorhodobacter wandonensis TaxID=1120568 RepID=UPI00067D4191|nr:cytochrome-c oxidase, cbb3-type subunit III [Pseudorhodobacter wandonensis]